ncbi:MAG: hypothetical protein WC955_07245 [Elusimicrobiota bacterium]
MTKRSLMDAVRETISLVHERERDNDEIKSWLRLLTDKRYKSKISEQETLIICLVIELHIHCDNFVNNIIISCFDNKYPTDKMFDFFTNIPFDRKRCLVKDLGIITDDENRLFADLNTLRNSLAHLKKNSEYKWKGKNIFDIKTAVILKNECLDTVWKICERLINDKKQS